MLSLLENVQSDLLEHRILFLYGEIDEGMAEHICSLLLSLAFKDKLKPVSLFINSEGGDITQVFAIHDTMCSLPCPIYTRGIGLTCSAASLLLAAGEKDNRGVYENTEIMIHQVSGGIDDRAAETLIHAKELAQINERMFSLYHKYTGKQKSKIKKDCSSDYFLDAIGAVKYGLADFVIGKNGKYVKPKIKKSSKKSS